MSGGTHLYIPLAHPGKSRASVRACPFRGENKPPSRRCRVKRMSLYCAVGGVDSDVTLQLAQLLAEGLAKLGERKRVLAVPPDLTRLHSQAGALTSAAWRYYGDRLKAVLPAIGTHAPMRAGQIEFMF